MKISDFEDDLTSLVAKRDDAKNRKQREKLINPFREISSLMSQSPLEEAMFRQCSFCLVTRMALRVYALRP